MMRLFFIFFLFSISLFARENPFFPVESSDETPMTSNKIENIPPLQRATISLPSSARVVESIRVTYKNLDGSIASKEIELGNAIDWHLPLFISQNYNLIENETPKKVQKKENKAFHKVIALDFISFYLRDKELKIVTKDRMLRDFLLVKPHRIVCDFKRDTDLGSYIKKLKKYPFFKEIRVGTHKDYYRVVIELDGFYQYIVKKRDFGYTFILR